MATFDPTQISDEQKAQRRASREQAAQIAAQEYAAAVAPADIAAALTAMVEPTPRQLLIARRKAFALRRDRAPGS